MCGFHVCKLYLDKSFKVYKMKRRTGKKKERQNQGALSTKNLLLLCPYSMLSDVPWSCLHSSSAPAQSPYLLSSKFLWTPILVTVFSSQVQAQLQPQPQP